LTFRRAAFHYVRRFANYRAAEDRIKNGSRGNRTALGSDLWPIDAGQAALPAAIAIFLLAEFRGCAFPDAPIRMNVSRGKRGEGFIRARSCRPREYHHARDLGEMNVE